MLLCTAEDVEARLGRPLTPDEEARIDAVIADVSAYLYAVAPRIPRTPPVPAAVLAVACELVGARLSGTSGIVQEALGGYSVMYRQDTGGGTLTGVHEQMLRPWMRPRVGTVRVDPGAAEVVGR